MEKLLPAILLSAYIVRLLLVGASIGEALVIISLSSLLGLKMYLEDNKEEPINDEIKKQITQLNEELKTIKDSVASIKLGVHFNKK